jgi:hypothetical protein
MRPAVRSRDVTEPRAQEEPQRGAGWKWSSTWPLLVLKIKRRKEPWRKGSREVLG